MKIDWNKYPNFEAHEFRCKHTGLDGITENMVAVCQALRNEMAIPLSINSGYRHKTHPKEARKASPGEHAYGWAVDISIHGVDAIKLIGLANEMGICRIGVHQKGNFSGRFIHIGIGDKLGDFPQGLWTY